MADCMNFPNTFDEFAEQYKIVDKKEVYTNGTELIPIFRVKQWLDHTRAYTVRKMQERVLQLFPCDKKFTTISRFAIDQIAKEMLEDEK